VKIGSCKLLTNGRIAMSTKTARLAVLAALGSVLLFPAVSKADEYHTFMTVSCLPAIGFFSIETHGIYNPPEGYQERNANILTAERLERAPYTCLLGRLRITVRGWCRQRLFPDELACPAGLGAGVGREQIAIFADDEILPLSDPPALSTERIHWLDLSQRNDFSLHRVEISFDATAPLGLNVLHCRSNEGTNGYPMRYGGVGTALSKVDTECRALTVAVPNR
jgi:hypothetical protein